MSMNKTNSKFTDLLALLVFAVFALCVLLVLLTGAKTYRALVQQGGERYAARTAAQYVSTRIRQASQVQVEDFQGCPALALGEIIDEECYVTYIYCYEGFLRELFCAESADLSPEDGEKVLEAEKLTFTLEGDLLTVHTDDTVLQLSLRAGKEVGA